LKVLIADDDKVFVELVSARLRAKGYKVVSALDAMQAFMLAIREVPDAILLDVNMPAGNGLEVLKKLKGSAKTGTIPVIIVSGVVDSRLPWAAQQLGATELLAKPASFAQILAALQRVLAPPPPPPAGAG
jgi:DNA-binding response OmpR family regulator